MTTILGKTRKHDIYFRRDGRIYIASRVGKMLGLKCGDVVDIAISDGGEYLLYKKYDGDNVYGKHEGRIFPARRKGRDGHGMITNSVALCRAVLDATKQEDGVRLPIGSAEEYGQIGIAAPIITRNIL